MKNPFSFFKKGVTLNQVPARKISFFERLRRKQFKPKLYNVLFDLYIGKTSRTQQNIKVLARSRSEAYEKAVYEAQEMIRIVPQKAKPIK